MEGPDQTARINLDIRLKKNISFLIQFKNERITEILQAARCHIYDCINIIYNFIKPFLVKKKCLVLRNMESLIFTLGSDIFQINISSKHEHKNMYVYLYQIFLG